MFLTNVAILFNISFSIQLVLEGYLCWSPELSLIFLNGEFLAANAFLSYFQLHVVAGQ